MTEWDKVRETVEFEQASRLFQPLAGVMSDRFTSASQPDDGSNPLAVVEKVKINKIYEREQDCEYHSLLYHSRNGIQKTS